MTLTDAQQAEFATLALETGAHIECGGTCSHCNDGRVYLVSLDGGKTPALAAECEGASGTWCGPGQSENTAGPLFWARWRTALGAATAPATAP